MPEYVAAQLLGGVLGALGTWAVVGNAARASTHRAANAPGTGVTDGRALVTEALITFALAFVVAAVVVDGRVPATVAPLAVGSALAAAVFVGGPVTGAAVNPARAFGPMIASGSYTGWWIFLLGPLVGGIAGTAAYRYLVAGPV